MTGPQLEHGYIRIANELFDAIGQSDFTKRQYKVLMCIIRKTYGFGKKTDDMTVQQIANWTGLTRPHASATIAELVALNTVLKRDGRYGYVLGINKNYGEWWTVPKQDTSRNRTTPVPKQDGPRPETGHTKDNPQKTTPKETPSDAFARFWSAYPRKVGKQEAVRRFRKIKPDDSLLATMLSALDAQKQSQQWLKGFIPNPSTWLNQGRWEDEVESKPQELDRLDYLP